MTDFATLGMDVDSSGLTRAQRELRGLEQQGARAEGRLTKGAATIGAGWKRMAVTAGAAFASIAAALSGGAIIRGISQFESSMSRVGAVSRATQKDLDAMRKTAIRLGSSTEFSASQAADGLNFLAMAGFDARESMEALPQVLDLATASGMGLANSADIASNVISGFGLAASDAAEVADTLAAASSRANTDVGQLGRAMSTVAPISASLGISVQETASAIGVLSDAGIQGERAGTAMRGVLASLAGPTKQAREAIEAYGLALEDVNPETNSLAEIMGRLNEAGLSTADAMTIFGREAASGALALVDANARVGELTEELHGAEGAAGDMADTMRDNLGGDIKGLMSALEGLILTIGEAGLTAVLRGAVKVITGFVRAMSDIIRLARKAATAIGDFFKITDAQDRLQRSIDNSTLAMGDQITEIQTLDSLLGGNNILTLETAQAHLEAARARRDEIAAMERKQEMLAKEQLGWDQLSIDIARAREEYKQLEEVQLRASEQGIDLPGITGDQASLAAELENADRKLAQLLSKQQQYKAVLENTSYLSPENQNELNRLNQEIDKTKNAIKNSTNGFVDFNNELVKSNGLSDRINSALSKIPGYLSSGAEGGSVLAEMLSGAARAAGRLASNLAAAMSKLPGLQGLGQMFEGMEMPGALGDIGNVLKGTWESVMRQVNSGGGGVGVSVGGGGGGGAPAPQGPNPQESMGMLDRLLNGVTDQTPSEKIEAWHEEVMTAFNDANLKERGMMEEHNAYKLRIEQAYSDQLVALKQKESDMVRNSAQGMYGALGNLLQQFAGKSKAAAVAAIAIQKGLSIAQIIANTAAAQMRALAELGPIAGAAAAAKIGIMGKIQAGLVAATGLMQAGSALGSSNTSSAAAPTAGGIGGGGVAPQSQTQSAEQSARLPTQITLNGEIQSTEGVKALLIEAFQGELDRGGRIIIP